LDIESFDEKKQLQIDHVFAGHKEARPGEPIELTVGLAGENGAVVTRKVVYPAPVGLAAGPLYFTVSDAGTANLTDFKQTLGAARDRRDRLGGDGIEDDPGGHQRMRILDACGLLALTPVLFGAGATTWEMNNYQDFIRGRFQGLSLTRDGRLTIAPKVDTLFSSDQPIVWSLAQSREGVVYAATGHRGRLYEIDKSGKSKLVWTADQPEIFALAI